MVLRIYRQNSLINAIARNTPKKYGGSNKREKHANNVTSLKIDNTKQYLTANRGAYPPMRIHTKIDGRRIYNPKRVQPKTLVHSYRTERTSSLKTLLTLNRYFNHSPITISKR